jgi:hypothetical protein
MNDTQRSASGGTRQPRAPSSVLRTCGLHHAASCGGNRVEGKFSLLQTIEIARNGKIYWVCRDGASMQVEIQTSRKHRPGSLLPVAASELAVAASSTAPVRRKHDPVVALDRGREPGCSRTPPLPAQDRVARGRLCRRRRAGAAPGALRAAIGVARRWRRNGLKRLNPRPEMVWARKPRPTRSGTRARADRARLRLTGRENALQLFAAKSCLLRGYWETLLRFHRVKRLKTENLKIRIKMPTPKKSSCFLLHIGV